MGSYYIRSIIGRIAEGIEYLIRQGTIEKSRKVILYGLDRHAFAMRTILSNLGYRNIEGYISDDEALVMQYNSEIKNFACKFLNNESDAIHTWTVQERLSAFDNNVIILIASKEYQSKKENLEALGYQENVHFYIVYDFKEEKLDKFFEKKIRMTLDEMKQVEKEILIHIDEVCRKNNLRYWVSGGTLLGTIRHKGFIPWDDDIDMFLPWKDYLKLIEIFERTERFDILGFGTSEVNDFPDPFMKVVDKRTIVDEDIGTLRKINPLFIDIFPLTGLPEDAEERHMLFVKYQELNRQIWQDFYAANGNTDIFPKWYHAQKELISKYDFDSSAYVGVLGTAYGERDYTTRKVYEETIRMCFEDIEVNVPVGYKEYLDNLYGKDWMELPDESKRKTHHNIQVYWN